MQDTARAPQPPTNTPIGHQMKFGRFWAKNPNFYRREQKMPIFGQESQSEAKFGRFWAINPNLYGGK